jgi:hypothetical protein
MKNYKPTQHNGILPPVIQRKIVVYRTIDDKGSLSHIHAPIRAMYLDWSNRPSIGRIHDFMVVG